MSGPDDDAHRDGGPGSEPGGAGLRVAVVGGSIGGLAAAVALAATGAGVTVLERASTLQGRGAGIVVQPETGRFLERFGLGSAETIGVASQARQVLDRAGHVTETVPTRQLMTSYDALRGALRAGVADASYRAGATVTGVDDRGVGLADGTRVPADLVVGADGAGSTVRAGQDPEVGPAYAGYVAWRGLVEEADLPASVAGTLSGRFTFHTDTRMQILSYLIPGAGTSLEPGRRRLNWVWYLPVAADDLAGHLTDADGHAHDWSLPEGAVPAARADAQRALARRSLPPVFAELVEITAAPFVQAITDLRASRLVRGRTVLLGDAAAVPRPHTAWGSAKAAVDAETLADAVAAHPGDLDAALRAWEPGTARRAADVVAHGIRLGDRFRLGV